VERLVILTATGPDRTGLVEEISKLVLASGGGIGESRMASLYGRFIVMLLIAGDVDAIERLEQGLPELRAQSGLEIQVAPADSPEQHAPKKTLMRFAGKALDQPGLVHEVAKVFRTFGANVETMETTLEPAPVTGTPTFAMAAETSFVKHISMAELEAALGAAYNVLDIDWSLIVEDRP
jgi:glycine cleavage system transcriptional repressor